MTLLATLVIFLSFWIYNGWVTSILVRNLRKQTKTWRLFIHHVLIWAAFPFAITLTTYQLNLVAISSLLLGLAAQRLAINKFTYKKFRFSDRFHPAYILAAFIGVGCFIAAVLVG